MNPKTECLKCINYSGHVILDENFFFLSEVGRALEVQTSVPVADFKISKVFQKLPFLVQSEHRGMNPKTECLKMH